MLALKSPNRYVQAKTLAVTRTMQDRKVASLRVDPSRSILFGPLLAHPSQCHPPYTRARFHSLEGATSTRSKRPASCESEEVQTASGAFQRMELQWKDVNYTVREGRKGEIVKKVGGWLCGSQTSVDELSLVHVIIVS